MDQAELQKRMEELRKEIVRLLQEKSARVKEISDLSREVQFYKDQLKLANEKVFELHSGIITSNAERQQLNEKLMNLENTLKQTEDQSQIEKFERNALEQKIKDLSKENAH